MHRTTADQNIAESVRTGAASIMNHGWIPTTHELTRACRAAKNGGERERERLVNMTSRLAFQGAAKVYRSWAPKLPETASFDDCYQAAIEGILRALNKYDPDSGNSFTTYAMWWIHQTTSRWATKQISSMSIPESKTRDYDPMGAALDIQVASLNTTPRKFTGHGGTPDERDITLADVIGKSEYDRGCEYDRVEDAIDAQITARAINDLPPKMRATIVYYANGDTLAQAGRKVGVTGERARQYISDARRIITARGLA